MQDDFRKLAVMLAEQRGCTHYKPYQAYHTIVEKRKSVASAHGFSFLWCRIIFDEDELNFDIDYGLLPFSVKSYISEKEKQSPFARYKENSYRMNIPAHEGAEMGSVWLIPNLQQTYGNCKEEDIVVWSIENGVPFGTDFLLAVKVTYHSGYDGEVDADIESEILYVDRPQNYVGDDLDDWLCDHHYQNWKILDFSRR